MYRYVLKPLLFLFDPEDVHYFVMRCLVFIHSLPMGKKLIRNMFVVDDRSLEKEVFGIRFPNPVGLAAGFDKNARWFEELSSLGFGFIEIGTVTPLAQPGNDRPRLFRLPKDEAIINRMGFNNDGVKAAAQRLKKRSSWIIIGGNIGKNKVTSAENAVDDYLKCFIELEDVVDYFVVNVSSPNTPGLRSLQDKEPLLKILNALMAVNSRKIPVMLKIAPDLAEPQLDDIVDIVQQTGIQGVIATNTTIRRDNLLTPSIEVERIGPGGLSGKPLHTRSVDVIRYLSEKSKRSFVIIGSGGIHSPEDAQAMIRAGADLVQVYTGFIYEGPGLVKRINKSLCPQQLF